MASRRTSSWTANDLREPGRDLGRIYEEETGRRFHRTPASSYAGPLPRVFDSWDSPRAQVYRRTYEIPDDLGTAVNVVQMVFGNKGDAPVPGCASPRDPATGEMRLYGEFLADAQGGGRCCRRPHSRTRSSG